MSFVTNTSPNENLDPRNDLINFSKELKKETLVKSLCAVAAIVIGVAAIVFLSANYVAMGIGAILIASLALYQYSKHYHQSKTIFMRAANELPHA